MKMKLAVVFVLVMLLFIGCASPALNYVKPHPNIKGLYVVSFGVKAMLNEYGPGKVNVRRQAEQFEDTAEINNFWDEKMIEAAANCLEQNSLIPSECSHGIVFGDVLFSEGSRGTATFSCKQ